MPRREFSRKIKSAAIKRAAGKCQKCHAVLKRREAEVDHILPCSLGGEATLANAQALCRVCHKEKSGDDVRRTRKADRQGDKNIGAVAPKQPIPSAGFRPSQHKVKRQASDKLAMPLRRPLYQEIQP